MDVVIGIAELFVGLACQIAFIVFGIRAITLLSKRQYRESILPLAISFICVSPIIFFFTFVIPTTRRELKESICTKNLATIRKALQLYAEEYTNYPPDLQRLSYTLEGVLICPVSGHKAGTLTNITDWTDYYYIAGLKESDPRECLLAYCNCPKHKRSIVLKLDGAITLIKPKELEALTNNFGITNQALLAEIKSRAKIIRGTGQITR